MRNVIFKANGTDVAPVCGPSTSYIGLKLYGPVNGAVVLSSDDEGIDEFVEVDLAVKMFVERNEHGVILRIERTGSGDFVIEKVQDV